MKRLSTLLTILALMALPAFAQGTLDPLPADARFDAPVEFATGTNGESLPVMIGALAKAVGLTAITDDVLDKTIVYDIGDPKPFRQVWNIVLTLNDLDYVLLENDVVVVGSPASVARLRTPEAAPTEPVAEQPRASQLEQRFYRVNSDPQQVVEILQASIQGLDAQALPGVQSVVVMGTQEQHDRVRSLLDQFDTAAEQVPLEQRTYLLSNAVAQDLAAVLTSTGVISNDETGQRLEAFTVVADRRTNSLIVTGSATVQARLAELIPQLDLPRKQVNVQIRIQEVAHSVTYDLGLDITGGFGQMAASILDTGLSFVFNSAAAVSSFNIGAILDALETQGLSQRVDDGTITVLDNQTGTIQSGGTIFISIPGASENIEREIPYGVQLEVTPRVANDGSVTLNIVARVEDVLSTTNDPSFLNLSTRAVTSTINLQPGQTALLGGLLQSNFTMTKRNVPILGAIPIIGELFGSTVSEDEKSDLILIVTSQVID
ncbi:MAG: secretin N-terminal domain-containing protein [Trueperaceae bacterium]